MRGRIFHKYEESPSNGVAGGIPHLKTIIIEDEEAESDRCVLYLGSHNFTKAAWGNY
jgi:phosphatidylserine/phosphatidylglycerophosphate/cardiolipin synthase-like enzyme